MWVSRYNRSHLDVVGVDLGPRQHVERAVVRAAREDASSAVVAAKQCHFTFVLGVEVNVGPIVLYNTFKEIEPKVSSNIKT